MTAWVDFKVLRHSLSFEQVLNHYKVEIKRKGDQHQGFCPLPTHKGSGKSPSFSANLKRGIFQCFGCGARGNLLEFAALMEGVDLRNGKEFRAVMVRLQEVFGAGQNITPPSKVSREPEKADADVPVVVNGPLDFELKGLDPGHPYLLERGFTRATIEHFGVGFAMRGLFKGRIAIPLHDQDGRLIGYAGRVADDRTISEANPRYRFPSKRERNGTVHEFRKTQFVYNAFRFAGGVDDIIVVEGFTSTWWLHQCGLPHAVATMGSDCSEKQAELIASLVKPSGRVWLMPDGDEAGARCASSFLLKLSAHRFVRWVKLQNGDQPTSLSADQLKKGFTC